MSETKGEKKEETQVKKKEVSIEIYRKEGKTFFKFEINPDIEKLYAEIAEEKRESKSWAGLSFYSVPTITTNDKYKQKLDSMRLFDDFGTGLIRNGRLNIAWIRTVGGKGEIQVKEPLSFSELSLLYRNAIQFVKEHFEEQFQDFRIKGSLSVEI